MSKYDLTPEEKAEAIVQDHYNAITFVIMPDKKRRLLAKKHALVSIGEAIKVSHDEHEGEPDEYLLKVKAAIEALPPKE